MKVLVDLLTECTFNMWFVVCWLSFLFLVVFIVGEHFELSFPIETF